MAVKFADEFLDKISQTKIDLALLPFALRVSRQVRQQVRREVHTRPLIWVSYPTASDWYWQTDTLASATQDGV